MGISSELTLFLTSNEVTNLSSMGRLKALLYWHAKKKTNGDGYVTPATLSQELDDAGYIRPSNRTLGRLKDEADVKTRRKRSEVCLSISGQNKLEPQLSPLVMDNRPFITSTLLDEAEFRNAPEYVVMVTRQINSSYDNNLFDCCAVMIRRLIETQIIELFERKKVAGEIRLKDGNYKMLADILSALESSQSVSISRPAQNIPKLRKFKLKVADKSAHNRTFIAQKGDIDKYWEDLRAIILDLKAQAFD